MAGHTVRSYTGEACSEPRCIGVLPPTRRALLTMHELIVSHRVIILPAQSVRRQVKTYKGQSSLMHTLNRQLIGPRSHISFPEYYRTIPSPSLYLNMTIIFLFPHIKHHIVSHLILIPVGVISAWWLGTTSLSSNNDLINAQNRPSSLSSEFYSPALRDHQIQNSFLDSIDGTRRR